MLARSEARCHSKRCREPTVNLLLDMSNFLDTSTPASLKTLAVGLAVPMEETLPGKAHNKTSRRQVRSACLAWINLLLQLTHMGNTSLFRAAWESGQQRNHQRCSTDPAAAAAAAVGQQACGDLILHVLHCLCVYRCLREHSCRKDGCPRRNSETRSANSSEQRRP